MAGEEISLFGGRLRKLTLPLIDGPPGPGAPALKRLVLAQGNLVQIWDGEFPLRYLAFLELKPGAIRGNHYHRVKEELLYVARGEVELAVTDEGGEGKVSLTLTEGDLCLIKPPLPHAFKTIRPGDALEFSPQRFNPADSFPCPVL